MARKRVAGSTPACSARYPDGERDSYLVSTEMFQVRLLVGVLTDGSRGVAVPACLTVNQTVRVRLPPATLDCQQCAPGRAVSLQNWRTGFKSLRCCFVLSPASRERERPSGRSHSPPA